MNNNICWCEVSGECENLFIRACTLSDVIKASVLIESKIYTDIEIDVDDYHYYRKDYSGKRNVKKIAYGNIELE
jgi:hypothetical protein